MRTFQLHVFLIYQADCISAFWLYENTISKEQYRKIVTGSSGEKCNEVTDDDSFAFDNSSSPLNLYRYLAISRGNSRFQETFPSSNINVLLVQIEYTWNYSTVAIWLKDKREVKVNCQTKTRKSQLLIWSQLASFSELNR